MSKPEVHTVFELHGPYPEYFRVDPERIGTVMEELAGITPEVVETTSITFTRGDGTDAVLQQAAPTTFELGMTSIARACRSQELHMPEVWRQTFPEVNVQAGAHFILANAIGRLKALHEVGPTRLNMPKVIGSTALIAAVEAKFGAWISNNHPFFIFLGLGLGTRTGLDFNLKSLQRKNREKVVPVMESFLQDPRVPVALNGALDFDFRG